MLVGILAGGFGTRLQEQTYAKPKPLVEVGGQPILWHIMKLYAASGFNEFVIALGYKGDLVKDYFLNYHHRASNLTIRLKSGEIKVHHTDIEDWTVHLLDTGMQAQTGGRIRSIAKFAGGERFMATYGDGVAALDIKSVLNHHNTEGKLATITAVRPPARFGRIDIENRHVINFEEKSQVLEGWMNGGFFVLEPEVVDYIKADKTIFELEPLKVLARDSQLTAYLHDGFWQCMDSQRDVAYLEELWQHGLAPWKLWS